jgi:hypothetical protein
VCLVESGGEHHRRRRSWEDAYDDRHIRWHSEWRTVRELLWTHHGPERRSTCAWTPKASTAPSRAWGSAGGTSTAVPMQGEPRPPCRSLTSWAATARRSAPCSSGAGDAEPGSPYVRRRVRAVQVATEPLRARRGGCTCSRWGSATTARRPSTCAWIRPQGRRDVASACSTPRAAPSTSWAPLRRGLAHGA